MTLECANFLARRGHEVHVFSFEFDDQSLDSRVIRHALPAPRGGYLRGLRGFISQSHAGLAAMENPPDVIGSFGIQAPPGSVVWMQSVHKAWIEVSGRGRDWKGRLKQRLNPAHPVILRMERKQLTGREYGAIVALSEVVAADIVRFYNVPRGDITVIPNGFSPDEFRVGLRAEKRERVRAELGYAPDDRVIVFVANELERKGFGPLCQAVATLGDPKLHVLAIGRLDGAACAPQIARIGLEGRVQFTGPTSDVASLYAASDVFALPTQYEAWGLVIVEAMACGLPVLTSRLAGAAIAVREGENGWLLDNPRDEAEVARKLAAVLQIPTSAEEIALSVAPYAWDQVLLPYEALLEQVAARRRLGSISHGGSR